MDKPIKQRVKLIEDALGEFWYSEDEEFLQQVLYHTAVAIALLRHEVKDK